ncbi:bacteriocin immunity protein [Pseudomonas sp. WOUb67]|uniref:bacteriocin immunity protein n=1 Tax=Pseudomonas sp. WOUb67 TaxID=3161136 RepID=UPI003CFBB6AC
MKTISDYTEKEFFMFVYGIYHADQRLYPTERSHIAAVFEFKRLSEHPLGADLIFYPTKNGIRDSPESVVEAVKKWRAEQGLPGFKEV